MACSKQMLTVLGANFHEFIYTILFILKQEQFQLLLQFKAVRSIYYLIRIFFPILIQPTLVTLPTLVPIVYCAQTPQLKPRNPASKWEMTNERGLENYFWYQFCKVFQEWRSSKTILSLITGCEAGKYFMQGKQRQSRPGGRVKMGNKNGAKRTALWGAINRTLAAFAPPVCLVEIQYLIYKLHKLMERSNIEVKSEELTPVAAENNLLFTVVQELRTKYDCQKILHEAIKKFQIKQYNILSLSIEKVLQIYEILKNKFYSQHINSEFNDQWYDNELRLFIWLFVCYCYVFKKSPEDITKKEWSEFSQVFKGKKPFLFEYQAKIIKKMNKKTKKWSGEEDQCLNIIIKDFTTLLESMQPYKWSQVAKKLFMESNKKYFRTPKQCRQRWMNHLDPLKLKSKWTPSEDFCLMNLVLKEGKKWAMIAKIMGNIRTEHMVKNRYNSLLRAEMKKHDDIADEMRVVKKMQNRIKYSLELKNNTKLKMEWKQKAENAEEGIEKVEEEEEVNKFLAVEQEGYIEAFDDILDALKKQEPERGPDMMQEWDQSLEQDEGNGLNIGFEFQPTYLDYI